MQLQYDIIKLNTGSIPFPNRKYKGREKISNERKKMEEKNPASANINSREVLRIEYMLTYH